MLNQIIGNKIKLCRLENKLTQEKLADTLMVSHQLISKWETGASTPDISHLFALSQLFNVSIDFLCDNEDLNHNNHVNHLINQANFNDAMTFTELDAQHTVFSGKIKQLPNKEDLLIH